MPTSWTGRTSVPTTSWNGRSAIINNDLLITNVGSYLLTNGSDRLIILTSNGTNWSGRTLI